GPLAPNAALHVAFPVSRHGRHTEVVLSELHTWPVRTPVHASPTSLRTQAHDSGPKWCAAPFLCGSLIRYSLPVYPGAFLDHLFGSHHHHRGNGQSSALAVFKLIISSNLVGCSTGKSAGFFSFSIFLTLGAA